ncbi:hypothetical protein SAMN05216232_0303 [Virgibacillus subterraneus]|uniref:Tn3 transposase DDE domain-containing protein n=1 Tax=Virgibacillus subterraneus TaxID=621109 RepID=A0A1H8Z6E3_9BACI|nr:hypothetical protein SAMN05216232_0303 [Virgibacillus subterraneus]
MSAKVLPYNNDTRSYQAIYSLFFGHTAFNVVCIIFFKNNTLCNYIRFSGQRSGNKISTILWKFKNTEVIAAMAGFHDGLAELTVYPKYGSG